MIYFRFRILPEWAFWVFGLTLLGLAFGADKQHDYRDWVGPLLMVAAIIIALQYGQWEIALAVVGVLVLKLMTR